MMQTMRSRAIGRVRTFGFSLVELMVAIVIGMLSMLVVLQVFTTFEEQKRVSTGGSESLEHGAIALNMLASRLGQAGFGVVVPNLLDCLVRASAEPEGAVGADSNFTFRLRPAFIDQGAGGAPDQVSIVFGSSPILGGVDLITSHDGSESDFEVTDTYGFAPRGKFIVSQPYSGSGVRRDCSLREATQVSAAPAVIKHASRYEYNDGRQPLKSKNNRQGGSQQAYLRGAKIYNFGNPSTSIFTVRDGHLLMGSPTAGPADWAVLLDNVISLQAVYGFDTRAEAVRNDSLVVDTFSETFIDADGDGVTINSPGGDADDWLRLGALRVGIVVRTSQAEMPPSRDPDQCTATTQATIEFPWAYRDVGGAEKTALTVNVSREYDINGAERTRADWRCYRYKAFDTVVALRNIKWNLPK